MSKVMHYNDENESSRDLLEDWEPDRSRSSRNPLRRLAIHHWVGLFFIAVGTMGLVIAFIVIPSH